jgi:hypothetical protein
MDDPKTVTATFTKAYTLRIGLSGTGSGKVTSQPPGINCGSICTYSFAENTVVTLTATPDTPSAFAGWTSGDCSGTGTCQVTMNAGRQAVAVFNLRCSGIKNCNFESGRNGEWTEYSVYANTYMIYKCSDPLNCAVNGIPPHSGNYLAWLGGTDAQAPRTIDISYIEQKQILVPSIAPYLMYWQWIESEDFCGLNYDYTEIFINGTQVDKYDLCVGTSAAEWISHNIDLTSYAGQLVTLRIQVTTDDSNISNLYIDDISILVGP